MSERWKITEHARARMAEMGLSRPDVVGTVVCPEADYGSPPEHPEGRRIALKGRLAVVYEPPPDKAIITVLWRGQVFVRPSIRLKIEAGTALRNLDNGSEEAIPSVTPGQ